MLWTITSVGRFTRAMVCAIVNVLPEPVTPSSTWCVIAALEPFDQLANRARLVAGEREVGDEVEAVVHGGHRNSQSVLQGLGIGD